VSNVSHEVVKEYFETLGYLVCQPRKHTIPALARPKTGDEDVDLVVSNPSVAEQKLPDTFVWDTSDLQHVRAAMVGVRGWHTERIYASAEQTPELLRFLHPAAMRFAGRLLGTETFAKVLCLPALPASGELRQKTIESLKSHGVDGVIPFRTILLELVRRVEVNRNYERSDLLQVIRLLKNYGLVDLGQMDLFRKRHASKSRGKSRPEKPPAEPPETEAPATSE
jgi:hypothetical protein